MTTANYPTPANSRRTPQQREHDRRKREIDREGARRALKALEKGMRRGGYSTA